MIVTGDGNIINPASAQPPRVWTIPARLRDFTGRAADLLKLVTTLTAEGRAAVSAVCGMGGIGKTSLAFEAAHAVAEHFPDGGLYLDLQGQSEQPMTPAQVLTSLLLPFLPPTERPPDALVDLQASFRKHLAGKRLLLLLDNVRDMAQVEPLLPPEPVALLVTSRQLLTGKGIRPLDLEVMRTDEAIELLRKLLHGIREMAEADLVAVVGACGHLPIAIDAACAFLLGHPGWSVREYLAELESDRFAALPDVERVLGFSILMLAKDDPEAAARFHALSVFTASFDRAAAAAVWATDERTARALLDTLLARSLLLYDQNANRWRLHDLYRDLANQGLDDTECESAAERHSRHFANVLRHSCDVFLEGGDKILDGLALFDREWANVEAGQAWAATRAGRNDEIARLAADYPDAGAYVLMLRLSTRSWIAWLESQVAACRKLRNLTGEGNALGNLGSAWREIGQAVKALDFCKQWLEIARQTGNRQAEGAALNNLGLTLVDVGNATKALRYFEEMLFISREIGDRRGEGNALGNLGLACGVIGQVSKSLWYSEQWIAIAREIGDRQGEGAALGNLGMAYKELGETQKAIGLFEQRLAIVREIGDRRGEGSALWSCVQAYEDLGDRAKAIELAKASLVIRRQIEDPNRGMVEVKLREWGVDPDAV